MIFKKFIFIILLCWVSVGVASETFEAGRDYQVIAGNTPVKKSGKVTVLEFFSYGCPACFYLEPTLELWLKTKPTNVTFNRIPVVFHPEWENYAKVYFVMKTLNQEQTLSPKFFVAIHEQNQSLINPVEIQTFFEKNGVEASQFKKLFDAPKINAEVHHAQSSLDTYGISSVPTVVVNGSYKLSVGMVNGDYDKFVRVLNYLIKKSQTS